MSVTDSGDFFAALCGNCGVRPEVFKFAALVALAAYLFALVMTGGLE